MKHTTPFACMDYKFQVKMPKLLSREGRNLGSILWTPSNLVFCTEYEDRISHGTMKTTESVWLNTKVQFLLISSVGWAGFHYFTIWTHSPQGRQIRETADWQYCWILRTETCFAPSLLCQELRPPAPALLQRRPGDRKQLFGEHWLTATWCCWCLIFHPVVYIHNQQT